MKRVMSSFAGRTVAALFIAMLGCMAFARAASPITVNKQFGSNVINLGATTSVTITLENGSTTSPATITAFKDDLATMGGVAAFAAAPGLATTCVGGNPSISGTQVLMSAGQIPTAPNPSTPGTCQITFNVVGAQVGTGGNTIVGTDVVTNLGTPSTITQTLVVNPVAITATGSGTQTVQAGTNGTVTFTITNPAVATALTNATIPLVATGNGTLSFQITGGTTTCGAGVVNLPPAGTSGTATVTGGTIPANGSCTVTLTITTPSVLKVNVNLASSTITDDQGATNSGSSGAATSIDNFVLGQPNVSKSFNPTTLVPGTNTTLKINVQNVLTSQNYTNATITDTLPASLTLVSATTNANCGAATVGGVGTGTITLGPTTMTANATCTITATVNVPASQPQGGVTNTIPTTGFTSDQVNSSAAAASASLSVTGSGGGFTMAKAFTPTSTGPNTPVKVTLTFTSVGKLYNGANGAFTDPLPATPVNVSQLFYYTDATHTPGFSAGCGASGAVTSTPDLKTVSGSGLSIPLNGTCVVTFWVEFTTPIAVQRTATNTITAASANFGGDNPVGAASANIAELPAVTLTNYVASAAGVINQPLTVSATINDAAGVTDGNLIATFPLNTGAGTNVVLAPVPNFQFSGCPANIASFLNATPGTTSWSIGSAASPLPSISATCTITYNVIDKPGVTGSFGPGTPVLNSNLTGNTNVNQTATQQVTFSTTHLLVNKKFTPNQIQAGSVSLADITVTVAPISGFATTQANGVGFSDTLPTGMTFAPLPNVALSAGCQQTGQPAPTFAIAGSTVSFSGISLLANGSTPVNCDATFNVTSSTVGAPLNAIPASSLTSTAGITNPAGASASLTVQAGVAIQKTFVNPTLTIGGTDYVRFLITNSASTSALTGGVLTDPLPAQLALASLTLGPQQAGDPPLCGGNITSGSVGSTNFTLGNLTVGPVVGTTNGQCVVYVLTQAAAGAAPGVANNTIPIGGLTIGGYQNQQPTTGTVTLVAPPNVTLSKAFAPTSIAPTGTSVLTITVTNTATGSVPLTGLHLVDTLPSNITIASTPNGSTTCGAGTVTATAGGASVTLAGGSIGANATCTIAVTVTGTVVGSYTNTIPAGGLTTSQGASNPSPATAPISIANAPSVTLAKAFAPVEIPPGGTSVLTISIANTASGAPALSGLHLVDTLPANITVAATPNASTTCGSGTVTAAAGASNVTLAAGSVAAAATCTITLNVTGTVLGNYTNTIPAGGLTSSQGATNPGPATAPISISNAPAVSLSKAFNPTSISPGDTSILTITIANTATGAVALSGVTLTDTLPANITIAQTPNASTTCGSGTVAATAGSATVALTGGSLGAGATCTILVTVTGSVVGSYTNTIPAGGVTSSQGATNPGPAQAPITIAHAPGVTISKIFAPAQIDPDGISTLTISIANTKSGAIALTGLTLVDVFPKDIVVAKVPKAKTTCGSGSVTAIAGDGRVGLHDGSLAALATCTISVDVTGSKAGKYDNVIPGGSVHTHQGPTNPGPAQAPITISSPKLVVTKSSDPENADVAAGDVIVYTVDVKNTGTAPETGAYVDDRLANATLIAGSVRVDGKVAPDSVITAKHPFGTVAPDQTVRIVYKATVNTNVQAGEKVTNDVTVGGDQGCTGTCSASSPPNRINPPKLKVVKRVDGKLNQYVVGGQTVVYSMEVTNIGASDADNTTLVDDVPMGVTPVAGSVTVDGTTAPKATVVGQVVTVPLGKILPGASHDVAFKATVEPTESGPAVNVVTVTADGIKTIVSNPVTLTRIGTTIAVTKIPSATAASAGDRVDYLITVTPPAGVPPFGLTTVVDTLPNYEFYAPGTARVDNRPFEPSVRGQVLTWTLPSLAKTVTIFYSTVVAPGVPPSSTLTNVVDVTGQGPPGTKPATGTANASVLVLGSTLGSCYPITGRVYLDVKGSGRFEEGDIGIPGVYVYMDDGEHVVTDGYGRYNFACVRPGMHALRLDESSLPQGVTPYDDRNIDSERSTRRLVHGVFDTTIIQDVNFAVKGTPAVPIPAPNASPPAPPGFPPPK